MMFNRIINFLSKTKQIPRQEIEVLKGLAFPVKLMKNEFLYKEGEIPNRGAFILKGVLREYFTDAKGNDYIRRFGFEDWWMVDMYELMYQKPALCSVQAVEDCELLIFTKGGCNTIIEKCPVVYSILTEISAASEYSLVKNEKAKLSLNAKEVYLELTKRYPNIDKRVALYHIASYLNIKPESLSRIRKTLKK